MIVRINLTDSDNPSSTESENIIIDDSYVDKIENTYDAWDKIWNGGEGYDTYEEFVDEWDENELIRDNFQTFLDNAFDSWTLSTFINLFSKLYPDAKIDTVDVKKTFNFTY